MVGERTAEDWREARRLQAWELHAQGWLNKQIALSLGVSEGAVSQWLKRGRQGGWEALRSRPRRGARPRLTRAQRERLLEILRRGAAAHGFPTDAWTHRRIAAVVREEFGVAYHHDYAGRLARGLGWGGGPRARSAARRASPAGRLQAER